MKLIAENEFDTQEVMNNLSDDQKIERLTNLYYDSELLEVLGFYDGSNEDVQVLEQYEEGSEIFKTELYKIAIINGNFEQSIAMNIHLCL